MYYVLLIYIVFKPTFLVGLFNFAYDLLFFSLIKMTKLFNFFE